MKTKLLLPLLVLIIVIGCKKEETYKIPEKSFIIKEVSKNYIEGNIKEGEQKIIQSKKELLAIFSQSEINKVKELRNINFTRQTLLLGCDFYENRAEFRYNFSKQSKSKYLLSVKISGGATSPDYKFKYGVIVSKLPAIATVDFKITKLQYK